MKEDNPGLQYFKGDKSTSLTLLSSVLQYLLLV